MNFKRKYLLNFGFSSGQFAFPTCHTVSLKGGRVGESQPSLGPPSVVWMSFLFTSCNSHQTDRITFAYILPLSGCMTGSFTVSMLSMPGEGVCSNAPAHDSGVA